MKGRTPASINPEFRKTIAGDEPVINYRPADDIAPQMAGLRNELAEKGYAGASTEDVLS